MYCFPHIAIVVSAVLAVVGCGPHRAETFPVTGTVTYKGQPVEGAQVQFIPPKGRPATGPTDASGRFTLLTWGPNDGAIVGEHVVCVTKFVPKANDRSAAAYPTMISQLPELYASPIKSPLRASVTAAGPNNFRLELKDIRQTSPALARP